MLKLVDIFVTSLHATVTFAKALLISYTFVTHLFKNIIGTPFETWNKVQLDIF